MDDHRAQLEAFITQSTAGFAQVDLAGRFTLVNDRFCEIVGRDRDMLHDMTMQAITHPDDLPRNLALFQEAVDSGTPYTHEKRYIRPDGSIVWVNNSVTVIRRQNGEMFGVLAVTIDVTERRRTEDALHRNAESIRLAIEGAGMATWELDLSTMRGGWSPNRFDILGMPRSRDLTGHFDEWLERIHPDDLTMARDAALRCFEDGAPYEIEYRIRRADTGEERWLQSHGSRTEPVSGGAARFVGVSFDVTERRRADAALRDSEVRFRTIFEQANDYIFTLDREYRVTSCNPAVCRALGYTLDEADGMAFARFIGMEAGALEPFSARLMAGEDIRDVLTVWTQDGQRLVWEVDARPMIADDGRVSGVHAIARDVTEARTLQRHQRLLIDELNHRVKNMLAIVQAMAQQSFKGELAADSARGAFQGRLAALASAHDMITRDNWSPTPLPQVIRDSVSAMDERFSFSGPRVLITPKTAITLALAMHELSTNAIKYGALSAPSGHIQIDWTVQGEEAARELTLSWRERGGPAVTPPARRGFGTRMIERGLATEFGGRVDLLFEPDGLVCEVRAPLPQVPA